MPTLEDYVIEPFNHDAIIKSDYLLPERFKPQIAGGVCAALVLEYFKCLEGGDVSDESIIAQLQHEFPRLNTRQEIFERACAELKDFVGGFNAMSHQTGQQFTNLSPDTTRGDNKQAIKSRLGSAAGGNYVLHFCGPRGSEFFCHVIALRLVAGPTHSVFDPNLGTMQVPRNEIEEFIERLCETYLLANINIQEFYLLRGDRVETAREKFERGIPVPQLQPTKKS